MVTAGKLDRLIQFEEQVTTRDQRFNAATVSWAPFGLPVWAQVIESSQQPGSNPGAAEYDCGLMTIECTKRAAAYGLWGLWSLCGSSLFGDFVDVTFDTTRQLHEMLLEADDFTPLHEPQSNILVFRYVPPHLADAGVETLGQFNRDVRKRLIHSGQFYITQTTLNGGGAMRCTVMNPLTSRPELEGLLHAIRQIGRDTPVP